MRNQEDLRMKNRITTTMNNRKRMRITRTKIKTKMRIKKKKEKTKVRATHNRILQVSSSHIYLNQDL